ncbi:MAG: hypothetical protein HY330_05205 [Chloroflexi bacterium]|nr:hypothetical protein [Chloroflexota bacterium]
MRTSATSIGWLFLAAATAVAVVALALPPPGAKAADGEPVETALAGIRGNFGQVWWLENTTMQWRGYDPAATSGNTLPSLRQGEAYLIKGVKQRVAAVLGGASITLWPGDNYIVWGVAPDPLGAVPIAQALKPALAGQFSVVWLLDASAQTWYGYNPSLPWAQQGLQWLVPGYAYWFMDVTARTSLTPGRARVDLFPGSNLVAWPAVPRAPASSNQPLLPNLAPYTPWEWEAPLVLSTEQSPKRNGALSTKSPTWLRIAIANSGGGSLTTNAPVSIRVDGKPGPTWQFSPTQLPSKQRYTSGYLSDPLESWFTITPGRHTVTVVIDPDNQVQESDETDNVYAAEFTWADIPVQAPAPAQATPRELRPAPFPEPTPGPPPPAAPNLRPYKPEGWAAPFVFSVGEGDFSGAKPVDVAGPAYFAVAVQNAGNADVTAAFDVEVRLDNRVLATLSHGSERALGPGYYSTWSGRDFNRFYRQNIEPAGVLADGPHAITVTVDPANTLAERRKTDNVYVYNFTVTKGVIQTPPAKPAATPVHPTAVQLKAQLAKLGPLLNVVAPTLADDGKSSLAPNLMDVVEASYYLLTGRTVQQEREEFGLTIAIETRAQWVATIEESCATRYETTPPQRYLDTFQDCHRVLNRASGYFRTPRPDEAPAIHFRGDMTPRFVVGGLLHELGHFRQWATQKDSPETITLSHRAMKELQAQAFEAAGVRLLEELTGYNLATFEEVESWGYVDTTFDRVVAESATEEHNRAYLAAWGALLQDPALAALRWKLTTFGYLDSRGSLDLFAYAVSLPWQEWSQRIDSYLSNSTATVATAKTVVRSRLVYNLPPNQRPPGEFWKTGGTLP